LRNNIRRREKIMVPQMNNMAWEINFQTRRDDLTTVKKMTSNSRSKPIHEKKTMNFWP
jgi:hypothetical protein